MFCCFANNELTENFSNAILLLKFYCIIRSKCVNAAQGQPKYLIVIGDVVAAVHILFGSPHHIPCVHANAQIYIMCKQDMQCMYKVEKYLKNEQCVRQKYFSPS